MIDLRVTGDSLYVSAKQSPERENTASGVENPDVKEIKLPFEVKPGG